MHFQLLQTDMCAGAVRGLQERAIILELLFSAQVQCKFLTTDTVRGTLTNVAHHTRYNTNHITRLMHF